MSLQNRYTQSIKPKSVFELREIKKFREFVKYFQEDCEIFSKSSRDLREYLDHFSKIFREISSLELQIDFFNRINIHSTLINFKVNPIDEYLNSFWQNYIHKDDEIYEKLIDDLGRLISLPPSEEEMESLTDDEQIFVDQALEEMELNRVHFIFGMVALIHQAFMAFEPACKILCAFGCFSFALRYAKNEIIQHQGVWKTLKRIGNLNRSTLCDMCQTNKTCSFNINFEALANIYCYAFKFRLLADYEIFFYTLDYKEGWESMNTYLKEIKQVISEQRYIKNKCLEEKL